MPSSTGSRPSRGGSRGSLPSRSRSRCAASSCTSSDGSWWAEVLFRLIGVVALLAVSSLAWWLWQRRDGYLQGATRAAPWHREHRVSSGLLGVAFGSRATFVQFSSEFCQPCRRAAVVLAG